MYKDDFKPIIPPKNSRLESDGSRTVMVKVDIMLNGGTKFFATFRRRMPIHLNFGLQRYTCDVTDLPEMILERYPSLKGGIGISRFNSS